MESTHVLPLLTSEEVRVLGSLMEKSRVTPDNYPLTLNSTLLACNQKTSRYPVADYDENTVSAALDGLKRKGFVSPDTGGGSRTNKYKHNFHLMFQIPPGGMTAMCLLFLRGPLTPGEINSNSGRMYNYESLAEVLQTLQALMDYEMPMVKELPRQPGQKERRFTHLFSGDIVHEINLGSLIEPVHQKKSSSEERLEKLESEVADIKAKLEALIVELKG